MRKKTMTVSIELKKLQRIANYYQFPVASFFSPISVFKGKTRKDKMLQRTFDFQNKIKKLFEEYSEGCCANYPRLKPGACSSKRKRNG